MSATSALLTFYFLFFFTRIVQPYKIIIASDNKDDQTKYVAYVTAAVKYLGKSNLDVATLDLTGENQESAYTRTCTVVDSGGSMIISVAASKPIIDAIKAVYEQSALPTIQIKYGPWVYSHPDLSTSEEYSTLVDAINVAENASNYVTFVQPTTVMLNGLRDLVEFVNITEATILYDTSYTLDASLIASLSNLPLGQRYLHMATTEADIKTQVSQLKPLGGKNLILMGSMDNVQMYIQQSKTDMERKVFNWFIFTKDPRTFKCDGCTTSSTFYVHPLSTLTSATLDSYRDVLSKTDAKLSSDMDKITYAFYLDLVTFASKYFDEVVRLTSIYPSYTCSQIAFSSVDVRLTLTKVIGSVGMTGVLGDYYSDTFENYYQNLVLQVDSISYDDKAKTIKPVGEWTVMGKINEKYEKLLENIALVKQYRVVTLQQEPFVYVTKDEQGNTQFDGYCIELLEALKADLKFNYTIYVVEDGMYGSMVGNEWNGMIGELVQGHADIALGALSVTAERESYVDFTVPYYDLVGTTILMRKPDNDYDLFKFMTVLEGPVWGCIVGAYFFTSILLWLFDRFSPYSFSNNREKYKDDPEQREFNFKECLWFCMTSLTPQGGGEAPKNISGRLVAATWWLFGFIIIASYTANLAAFLTVSRLETQITSLDDLSKQYKVKYAPMRGTASETYFKRMADIEDRFYETWKAMSLNESMTPQQRAQLAVWDYPVSDKFNNMWRYMQEAGLPNTTKQAVDRVLRSPASSSSSTDDLESFAYIGDATEIRYSVLTDCRLIMVGTEFSRKPYAIAVQQLSPLKEQISSAILKLLNARALEQLKDKWWTRNPHKVNCPKQEDESDGISIQNIGGVFIVILIGIVLSVITLAFEYWYYRDKRRELKEQRNQQKRDQQDLSDREIGQVIDSKDKNANAIGLGVFSNNYNTKH